MDSTLPLRVQDITDVALGVKLFTFVQVDGAELPAFDAGSHIEVQLPNHVARSYSLLNAPGERHRYQVAVHLSPTSAGGSRYLHESLRVHDVVLASPPRNNFALVESARHSCLVAGGIGITPLLSMMHRLNALGRSWELHYAARTAEHAAFVEQARALAAAGGHTVHLYFDQAPGGQAMNLATLCRQVPPDTHLYCCGPKGMLDAFEQATTQYRDRAHVEYFTAKSEAALDGGYTIHLARTGLTLPVPAGRSILDVVFDAGISVPSSCREGICGSCETRLLEGQADHRDALLSDSEKQANRSIMICCSGARSPHLVLDL